MDTQLIRIVALVARQGSFAATARVLNVDPSSVSRSIAQAEAALGFRLFQRSTRHLAVTEEAQSYLARVEPLLDELDHAHEEAARSRRSPAGTIRVTASVAFAHECIVPHLSAFHERFPQIDVELMPTDDNLDILARGIDLAIRLAPAPAGDLVSRRLVTTRYRVLASPDYVSRHGPMSAPSDLSARNCLRFALPEYRTRWRFRRSGGKPFDVPVSGRTIIGSALSLRRAAVDGLGPALLADWLVARDLVAGRLVDLFPDFECAATEFETGAWALYPTRSYLPGKVRAMIDFLSERLAVRQT